MSATPGAARRHRPAAAAFRIGHKCRRLRDAERAVRRTRINSGCRLTHRNLPVRPFYTGAVAGIADQRCRIAAFRLHGH